jgi:hypothetical protein
MKGLKKRRRKLARHAMRKYKKLMMRLQKKKQK